MRALVLKRYGGLDQVAFADIPRPEIKPDEILVQVHAAGLNAIDCMIPKGTFKPILRFQLPATLGSDLAGEIPRTVKMRASATTQMETEIIRVLHREKDRRISPKSAGA